MDARRKVVVEGNALRLAREVDLKQLDDLKAQLAQADARKVCDTTVVAVMCYCIVV